MKTTIFGLITAFSLFTQHVAHAEPQVFTSAAQQTALIELYTSEGCSSCPPADKWLSGLKEDPRLWQDFIPLAFHVDYWDYIGWKDRFASPHYSDRQRRYAAQQSSRTVYTPGFVLNGREWRQWLMGPKLHLKPSNKQSGQLTVNLKRNTVEVSFLPNTIDNQALIINLALLGFDISSEVNRGENVGRTLAHDFVVLEHTNNLIKRNKDGSYTASLHLPRSQIKASKKGLVAWINTTSDLTPIQATGGYLSK